MRDKTNFDFWRQNPTFDMVGHICVLLLGRFLASTFSILSSFPPFSLNPHTTLLSETHLAYPIIFFPLVFSLSSEPLSPSLAGFHLWVYDRSSFSSSPDQIHKTSFFLVPIVVPLVFMSLQLIISILLHTHISKASSLRISSFLYVPVSAA